MFSDKKPPLTWIIQDTSSISSSRYTHAQIKHATTGVKFKHITTCVQLDCSVLTLHMLNLDSIQICWTDTGVLSISGSSNTCMYRRLFWHAMKLGRISNNFLKFCELTACEWEITMWHFIGGQPNFQEPPECTTGEFSALQISPANDAGNIFFQWTFTCNAT